MLVSLLSLLLLTTVSVGAKPTPSPSSTLPEAVRVAYAEVPKREMEIAWTGIRMLLVRKYDEALVLLNAYEKEAPQSMLPSLGKMLLYQFQMVENFDFRFEKEFHQAERDNERIMKKYFNEDKADRWQLFLAGASSGMRGLMEGRQRNFIKAASMGWEGIGFMFKADYPREGYPHFYDIYYGIGMYHYWVSWAQQKSLILAFFPDRREQGLKELKLCADNALLTSPLASFSLAYLNSIEDKKDEALELLLPLYHSYPENVIVRSLMGRLLISNGNIDRGILHLEALLKEEPQLTFLNFHLARALFYTQRQPERVRKLLEQFLAQKNVAWPDLYYSKSKFYLAEIHASKQDWKTAKKYLRDVDDDHLERKEQIRYQKLKDDLQ